MTNSTPQRISFTSARPWRWIAADLLVALELAHKELHEPGAAKRDGKDIEAILTTAISTAREA
jgi:hypothetical protein